MELGGRTYHIFGSNSPVVFLGINQGEHDFAQKIYSLRKSEYTLVAFEVSNWNSDFSPWKSPAVFGNEAFCGNGKATLEWLEKLINTLDLSEEKYIAGYSLAGLFALWSFYESGLFDGAVSCSGSLWFPDWLNYLQSKKAKQDSRIYLSLGDKEELTKNPVMSTVGSATRKTLEYMQSNISDCILEWNKGGHFKDPDIRTATGINWILR